MTSPFGPLVAIADVAVRDELPALERALKERDLEHRVVVADGRDDAAQRAAEALEAGGRFLVAVGDDRVVQSVVNGMFDDGHPRVPEAVLGVVPAGAASDLVTTFGLPADTASAVGHLAGTNTYPFDVMKIVCEDGRGGQVTRYAANLAEVGFGGELARRAGERPGNARRFLAFWSAWWRSRPSALVVVADRRTWEGAAFNVIVGNGQFTGGLRMSPRSFPGDGVLDALVFTGPRSDAYTMLPRIYRHGDHVPDPNIQELRAKIRIAVRGEHALPVVADGAIVGVTPATFQVVPQQILFKL